MHWYGRHVLAFPIDNIPDDEETSFKIMERRMHFYALKAQRHVHDESEVEQSCY